MYKQHECAFCSVCHWWPNEGKVCVCVCLKKKKESHECRTRFYAPPTPLQRCSTTKWSAERMSGLWECHSAESTGGEQWPRCVACLFGRFHAAFQREAPSAFGSVSLVDRAFSCWSLTCCAHCCPCSISLSSIPIAPVVPGQQMIKRAQLIVEPQFNLFSWFKVSIKMSWQSDSLTHRL